MINLDLELLDFSNIENVKQMIINNFRDNGLLISKIRKADGGIFVYHNRGMVFNRKVRTLIEETDSKRVYSVSRKRYAVDFVNTENEESFKFSLGMVITEAKHREEFNE